MRTGTNTLRKFRRYCESLNVNATKADTARRHLVAAGAELAEAANNSDNPLLLNFVISSVRTLVRNPDRLGRGQLLRAASLLEQELASWVLRLQDLVTAALDDADLQELLGTCRSLGFADVAAYTQMQAGDKLVGWRVSATRPE